VERERPVDERVRFYRGEHRGRQGWTSFHVQVDETDLWISALVNAEQEALEAVLTCRRALQETIAQCPAFLHSLTPLPLDPLAPLVVRRMLEAAAKAGVGPMAAVAGAIAQIVGEALAPSSPFYIVENGGDCFVAADEKMTVGLYAGPSSPFTGRIGLRFTAERFPLGICTSSGTIGHSLSFGRADAITVVAGDAALADAAATAIGNLVKSPAHINDALDAARHIEGLQGVLVAIEDQLGLWGNMEVIPLARML